MLDARIGAAKVLKDVLYGRSLSYALPKALNLCDEQEKPRLRQLIYGALRDYPRLLAILNELLRKPLKDKDADLKAILILGIYELEHMATPDYAVVSSVVENTNRIGKSWSKGLANGLLRRFLRERASIISNIGEPESFAHPKWMYERLMKEYPSNFGDIIEANNKAPPLTLRVNLGRISRKDYLLLLRKHGFHAQAGTKTQFSIYLAKPVNVSQLPGFQEGLVSVQDEAAQLGGTLLPCKAGEKVLDACSAPGGKACHLMEVNPKVEMTAMDIDPDRIAKVRDNFDRLGFTANTYIGDASSASKYFEKNYFDQILADVPCSTLGVVRRNPDIKVLKKPGDIASFAALQTSIIHELWSLLKPTGHLLYITCSILSQENDEVVSSLIQSHKDCKHIFIEGDWGISTRYGRQLIQSAEAHDGMFFSLLRKTQNL